MKLLISSIVLLAVSVAYGQKYCCYPDKWEGTEGILSGSADDEGHSAITTGNVKISMDATMQAIYIDENIEVGGMHREYKVLQLFAQNAQYIIVGNHCTRTAAGTWSPAQHCVPDDAKMLRKYKFGEKDMLEVTEYGISVDQQTIEIGVTDDCVPAVERLYGNIEGTNIFTVSGYFNLTLGIKDPNVFKVPAICNGAPLSSQVPPIVYRRKRSLVAPVY